MKSNCPREIEMPTVEECRQAADEIGDELLRSCVQKQCGVIEIKCGEEIRKVCRRNEQIRPGTVSLAYVVKVHLRNRPGLEDEKISLAGSVLLFYPIKECNWCEVPASHECIVKAVIHEVAHSCGWSHKEGKNVPGNDPPDRAIPECDCVNEKGELAPCE